MGYASGWHGFHATCATGWMKPMLRSVRHRPDDGAGTPKRLHQGVGRRAWSYAILGLGIAAFVGGCVTATPSGAPPPSEPQLRAEVQLQPPTAVPSSTTTEVAAPAPISTSKATAVPVQPAPSTPTQLPTLSQAQVA